MSDEEFLARWSRRKQEARSGNPAPEPAEPMEARDPASPPGTADDVPNPDVDPSSLPPIESIDAATDITAFLRKGIPQELSRAALRRAWTADPAIRDFVGLAENAWDFNDPNAMPGFGPLDYSAEQVEALVRHVVGGVVQAAESLPKPPAESAEDAARSDPVEADFADASDPAKPIADPRPCDESATAELPLNSAASQPPAPSEEIPLRRRTHGGALPQ
jgi:Protein of unknown function (DUF3306)